MLSVVTITGTFEDGSESLLSGTVKLTPSATVYSSGVPVLVPDVPVVAQIVAGELMNGSGTGPLTLVATDNEGLTVQGESGFWFWNVQVVINGAPPLDPWYFSLPSSPGERDLYSLAGASDGSGGGGSGTVTSVSVVTGNGFAGTVATPTTTPAITLETTVTGVLKGNGTAISAASAGTDYLAPNGSGAALTGITPAQAGADASGSAATAQSNAESFATSAVGTETSRAEAAEALLVPLAQKGAASGVAGLDSNALSLRANLPNVVRSDYKFAPEDNGGKANTIAVTDAVMNASSAAIACTTSTPFGVLGIGSLVTVMGAGAAGAPLYASVAGVADSGHATLSAAASTSVTAAGMLIGTDNVTAIRAAYASLLSFVSSSPREGVMTLLGGPYGFGGSPTVGGSTAGNAWFPLPPAATTGAKARIRWATDQDATNLLHWQQTVPTLGGLVLLADNGVNDATYGRSHVIGGPTDASAWGGGTSVFANVMLVIDGLRILVPYNGSAGGIRAYALAETAMPNVGVFGLAVVPSGGAFPSLGNPSVLSNFGCMGVEMPSTNNNAVADVGCLSVEGMVNGWRPSEHSTARSVHLIDCYAGMVPYSGTTGRMPHAIYVQHASMEENLSHIQSLGAPDGGANIIVALADIEGGGSTLVNDSDNLLYGSVGYRAFNVGAVKSGGSNITVTNLIP